MITITDNNNTATIELDQITETITPWFPNAPQEVLDQIEAIQDAALRGDYTGDLEAYLAIEIS